MHEDSLCAMNRVKALSESIIHEDTLPVACGHRSDIARKAIVGKALADGCGAPLEVSPQAPLDRKPRARSPSAPPCPSPPPAMRLESQRFALSVAAQTGEISVTFITRKRTQCPSGDLQGSASAEWGSIQRAA